MSAHWVFALVLSYLAGSIPTAYLLVKKLKQVDIRTVGSGNAGATNVTRAAGFKAGLLVFILDALKGVVAVKLIAPYVLASDSRAALACGVAAVAGHIAPVWLGFKGGKGVATAMGVLFSALPGIALICLAVWFIVFLVWRFVSLASLAAIGMLPVIQWMRRYSSFEITAGAVLALMVILKHQANIKRLCQGTESRWKSGK